MAYIVPQPMAEKCRQVLQVAASGAILAKPSPTDQKLIAMTIAKKHRLPGALGLFSNTSIPLTIETTDTRKNNMEKSAGYDMLWCSFFKTDVYYIYKTKNLRLAAAMDQDCNYIIA